MSTLYFVSLPEYHFSAFEGRGKRGKDNNSLAFNLNKLLLHDTLIKASWKYNPLVLLAFVDIAAIEA